MFTWKVLVPLVLALARQSKAHFNSACGTLGIIGVGSDTLSSQFNVYAFPHNTNPHSTANGTALGVNQDSVLGRAPLKQFFSLDNGTLGVPNSNPNSTLTVPLLMNGANVTFVEEISTPVSQFCSVVFEGESPFPILSVNGTLGPSFALCSTEIVFQPRNTTDCQTVDLRLVPVT